jgi:hypothetical protein
MNQPSNRFNKLALAGWVLASVAIAGVYAGSIHFARWERANAPGLPEPMVTRSRPHDAQGRVLPNSSISCDVYLPNIGSGVDTMAVRGNPLHPETDHVRLYKVTPQGEVQVPGAMNTSGGGDSIVFVPNDVMDTGTKYHFVCDGVRDTSGALFKPYSMSFTTADASVLSTFPVAFKKVQMDQTAGRVYTGLTMGPDHRLYTGTEDGEIMRFDIGPDGQLSEGTAINTIINGNKGPANQTGQRLVIGICFDPRSTPDHLIAWVTNGFHGVEKCPDWSSRLTRLEGPNLEHMQDCIVGLPRAWRDHLSFKVAMTPADPTGLYFDQGSSSSTGAADKQWGLRNEHLMTAACLRLDIPKIEARLAAGQGPLDVKTEDEGRYSPFAPGAPLTLYATGIRCGFGLLFHSNGHLYSCLNGGAAGGGAPSTPDDLAEVPRRNDEAKSGKYNGGPVPAIALVDDTQPDLFVSIEKGAYYGHPNPSRGEYVLFGGNPDNGSSNFQVHDYPRGTKPDRNWHPAYWNLGDSRSCNGLIEYKNKTAFGGALAGKILTTRYSEMKDVMVISLKPDGHVAETVEGITGMTQFLDPLDLVEDPETGNLYVSEFAGKKLTLLKPDEGKQSKVYRDTTNRPAAD